MAIKMEEQPTQTLDYKSQNRRDYPILSTYQTQTSPTHIYSNKNHHGVWDVTSYSVKRLSINCIDRTPKGQYFYTVNNMKELFEHIKVDKILAFLKAVGLYKRI